MIENKVCIAEGLVLMLCVLLSSVVAGNVLLWQIKNNAYWLEQFLIQTLSSIFRIT